MAVIPPIKRGKCVQEKERWGNISDTKKRKNGFYVCSERYISEENNKSRPRDPAICNHITRKEKNRCIG